MTTTSEYDFEVDHLQKAIDEDRPYGKDTSKDMKYSKSSSRLQDEAALSKTKHAFEARVDDIEARLRQKMEVMCGFGGSTISARKLQSIFRAFDRNCSGSIDYNEFFEAMTKMNFIGLQRELEALFHRYDEVGTQPAHTDIHIDYPNRSKSTGMAELL